MWNDLPQELLDKAFGYIDSKAQLAECRLVCKRWCYQADAILLGQHIILNNDGDVLQLYKFLNGNTTRGSLVRHLTLLGPCLHDYLLGQLVHLVFTPTMEKLEGRFEGHGSDILFEINSNALDDASGFDRLTVLPTPQEFTLMYFNTLAKFKRSLQSMALHFTDLNHSLEEQYIGEHLLGFEALRMLDLKIKINNVTDVEQILQHFNHLEQLEITLDTECTFIMSEKRLLEWTTSSVTVVKSLGILKIRGCFFGDVFEPLLQISQRKHHQTRHNRITIQSKRISKLLVNKFSHAGIDLTSHLPETDYITLARLALVLCSIDGTQHLQYDANRKLMMYVNAEQESTYTWL
ncbi:hypothetical protein MAM1_0185c07513 [Mucor ambiguus]|uniref:F-box domain-containing protein n=1 Tax=Mucor ambiguus TaxID=91626 RepID=A0A0C9N095_9FUNG|nr:hypothetical protein MAM1_0185c07513 [Mucor ambiguus]